MFLLFYYTAALGTLLSVEFCLKQLI